jgi:hypothetical protein
MLPDHRSVEAILFVVIVTFTAALGLGFLGLL